MSLLERALSQYGVKEIPGKVDNPIILNYFHEINHSWVKSESTAWCSAFINWCSFREGLVRSNMLDARSWLGVGNEVMVPRLGDVVIYWREKLTGWKGHVGLFITSNKGYITTLGGNQNNSVCMKPYPEARVLGYRRI